MNRLIVLLCCTCFSVSIAYSQEFTASHLEKAAKKLNIVAWLSGSSRVDTTSVGGQRIVARKNADGQVEHIGIPLFNAYMRSMQPSPIHDYLEFAALDKKFHVSENTLQLNRLQLSKGSWDQLYQMGDTVACTIHCLADKVYVVSWQMDGKDILELSFPVDYELLANSSRRELEVRFVKDLRAFKMPQHPQQLPLDTTSLKAYAVKNVFVREGQSYVIPAITSHTYYTKAPSGYALLSDPGQPAQTMANMLLQPSAFPKVSASLSFAMSTYQEETVNIDYLQLYQYCVANGCEAYFGYEGTADGMASGTLLMHNRQSGYNHIFYIQCPQSQVGQPDAQLKGRGYIYTPATNVKTLFAPPAKNKSGSYKYIVK